MRVIKPTCCFGTVWSLHFVYKEAASGHCPPIADRLTSAASECITATQPRVQLRAVSSSLTFLILSCSDAHRPLKYCPLPRPLLTSHPPSASSSLPLAIFSPSCCLRLRGTSHPLQPLLHHSPSPATVPRPRARCSQAARLKKSIFPGSLPITIRALTWASTTNSLT